MSRGPATADALVALFDRTAPLYDAQLVLERRALRAAARLAGPVAGRVVVDLAAGTGALSAALARHGGPPTQVVAVDAAPRMLARSRRRITRAAPGAAVRLVPADVRAVPLPDASADVVAIGYLLHLLAPADAAAVLAEARRLVRPGGRVVVVVHGSPPGIAGRLHRALWRGLEALAPGAVLGRGPLAGLAAPLAAAGLRPAAGRRVAGLYWSEVAVARPVTPRGGAPASGPRS